jgi:2-polyprenylphenol hydroxylase and related flavodoxin oxidoreductases
MKFSNIVSVKKIGRDFFEISFNIDSEVKAGQFLMVWVPGVKEIPMSVSNLKNPITISFKAIGETTKRLSAMRPGDRIFYRGPYGNYLPGSKRENCLRGRRNWNS